MVSKPIPMEFIITVLMVLGVYCFIGHLLYWAYKKKDKLVTNIEHALNLSVPADLQEFQQDGPVEGLPFVVIRGQVRPTPKGVMTASTGVKAVMMRITLKEHHYQWSDSLLRWYENVKLLHQEKVPTPFVIETRDGFTVTILNGFEADEESLFQTAKIDYMPGHITSCVTEVSCNRPGPNPNVPTTRFFALSIGRTEEVVPVDAVITAMGRLVRDTHTHEYSLVVPQDQSQFRFILSTLPVESIIERIQERTKHFKRVFVGVVSIISVVSGLVILKLFQN